MAQQNETALTPEQAIAEEIRRDVALVDEAEVSALVDAILKAAKVFVYGAGRSGYMMQALAMRLGHLGIQAWVVGETTTPAIGPGDLLIVGSGSGQTRTTLAIVEAARARGARTACITAHPDSPVGRACDLLTVIPSPVTKIDQERPSIQPPGSLFEQLLLVVGDGIVLRLMERLGTTDEEMRARHTKLE